MALMDNSRQRIGANTLFRTLSVSLFMVTSIVALSFARSVQAFSTDYSNIPSIVDQQDPGRLESITRDLEDIKLKLETTIEQIESGQKELQELSQELKGIEGRLRRLSDIPGYRAVENQLRNVRRTLMESSLRRALALSASLHLQGIESVLQSWRFAFASFGLSSLSDKLIDSRQAVLLTTGFRLPI